MLLYVSTTCIMCILIRKKEPRQQTLLATSFSLFRSLIFAAVVIIIRCACCPKIPCSPRQTLILIPVCLREENRLTQRHLFLTHKYENAPAGERIAPEGALPSALKEHRTFLGQHRKKKTVITTGLELKNSFGGPSSKIIKKTSLLPALFEMNAALLY